MNWLHIEAPQKICLHVYRLRCTIPGKWDHRLWSVTRMRIGRKKFIPSVRWNLLVFISIAFVWKYKKLFLRFVVHLVQYAIDCKHPPKIRDLWTFQLIRGDGSTSPDSFDDSKMIKGQLCLIHIVVDYVNCVIVFVHFHLSTNKMWHDSRGELQ